MPRAERMKYALIVDHAECLAPAVLQSPESLVNHHPADSRKSTASPDLLPCPSIHRPPAHPYHASQMLANAPNGKVSAALAEIYTKEGLSDNTAGDKKVGEGKVDSVPAGEAGGEDEYTPVVYVAMVSGFFRRACAFCSCR